MHLTPPTLVFCGPDLDKISPMNISPTRVHRIQVNLATVKRVTSIGSSDVIRALSAPMLRSIADEKHPSSRREVEDTLTRRTCVRPSSLTVARAGKDDRDWENSHRTQTLRRCRFNRIQRVHVASKPTPWNRNCTPMRVPCIGHG